MSNPFEEIEQRLNSIEKLLLDLKQPKQETQKYFTPVQLADLIGWKLSTVYQNHHNGSIPGAKKVGNRLLFESAIILAWIAENSIPTKAEKVKAIEARIRNK